MTQVKPPQNLWLYLMGMRETLEIYGASGIRMILLEKAMLMWRTYGR